MVRHDRPGRRPVEKPRSSAHLHRQPSWNDERGLDSPRQPLRTAQHLVLCRKRYRGYLGTALEDVDGNVWKTCPLNSLTRHKAVLNSTATDAFGYFSMSNVQEVHIIVFSKEGYTTVERTFVPDNVGLDPTMKPGNGTRQESDDQSISGWTLDNAVGLSTIIGILTIGTALLGVQSAAEIRRGKHYRRSQYLAAGALFSRGLIIVGPALILFGMIVNLFAKEDFEDQREDEHVPHLCRRWRRVREGRSRQNPRRVVERILPEVVMTHEPGGTANSGSWRAIGQTRQQNTLEEAGLFAADRLDHSHTFIRPHLAAGQWSSPIGTSILRSFTKGLWVIWDWKK